MKAVELGTLVGTAATGVRVGVGTPTVGVGDVVGASVGMGVDISAVGVSVGTGVGISAVGVGVSGAPTGSSLQAATAICKTTTMHKSAANADLRRATSLIV